MTDVPDKAARALAWQTLREYAIARSRPDRVVKPITFFRMCITLIGKPWATTTREDWERIIEMGRRSDVSQ